MVETITEEQKQQLQHITLRDGRNGWEYVNLFEEDKREFVAAGIISCIEQKLNLNPDTISLEAGKAKYRDGKLVGELTEVQKRVCPYPDFWEMQERGRRFQEFLPPYSDEDVIREMKARGQYRTIGWIL